VLRKFPVFVAVAFLAASTIPSRAVAQQLVIVEQASHHPGVITAIPAPQATLLIEAYNPNGSAVGLQGFIDYTHYVASSKWESFENYGVFPLGQIPGMASLASD